MAPTETGPGPHLEAGPGGNREGEAPGPGGSGEAAAGVVEGELVLVNRQGLHARPSQLVVKTASAFAARVQLMREDIVVDGKSIMGVMMLAAEKGTVLKVRAEGPDAAGAVDALRELFATGFGEPR